MDNVHRIHIQGGRFQIDLHVHDGGLISITMIDLAEPKRRFDGTLGSLMQTVDNEATFRGVIAGQNDNVHHLPPVLEISRLREHVAILRGLLREAQFYSHNQDLDRRIEEILKQKAP